MQDESRPRRLCSEIQLFDLCTREKCKQRDGRFCTDGELLSRFEAISDDEDAGPERQLQVDDSQESDEMEDSDDFDGFGDNPYPLYEDGDDAEEDR
jgi:hypothetical protein